MGTEFDEEVEVLVAITLEQDSPVRVLKSSPFEQTEVSFVVHGLPVRVLKIAPFVQIGSRVAIVVGILDKA